MGKEIQWLSFKTSGQRQADLDEYTQWAFKFGQAQKKKVEEIDEATEENIGEATDTSSNNYDIVDSTENMEPLKNTNKALYIWLSILGGALLIGAGAGAVLIFIRKKS